MSGVRGGLYSEVQCIIVHSPSNRQSIGGSKGAVGTRASWGSKFFHFHVVFSKNIASNRTLGVGDLFRKILDPPLQTPVKS